MMKTITVNTNHEWIKDFDEQFFDLMGLFNPLVSKIRVHIMCRGHVIGTRWI